MTLHQLDQHRDDYQVDDLVRQLAGGAGDPADVQVVRGRRQGRGEHVHGWLALPPGAPRVLVPDGSAAVAAHGLLAHSGLRRPGDRFRRRCLAVLVGSGVPGRLWHSARIGTRDDADSQHLLEALREGWDPRVEGILLSIRPQTPNHKPTFLAVDGAGRPLGYGKLAAAGVTERAQREVDGLRAMSRAPVLGLRSPELLADLTWAGCRVLVVSPLPDDAQRYPDDLSAPTHLLDHARHDGGSIAVEQVVAVLRDRVARSGQDWLHDLWAQSADELVGRTAGLRLQAGLLHGDWVPWNLAVADGVVWAFDWEHSEVESAAALDLVHWHVMVGRDRRHLSLGLALKFGEAAAARQLRGRRTPADVVSALLALHRLRLVARTAELRATSGRWPEGERDQLVGILDARTRHA